LNQPRLVDFLIGYFQNFYFLINYFCMPKQRGKMPTKQVFLPFEQSGAIKPPEQEKPLAIVKVVPEEIPTEEAPKEPAWKVRVRALMKSLDAKIDAADGGEADLVAKSGSLAWQIADIAIKEFGRIPFTTLLEHAARQGKIDELRARVQDLLATPEDQVPVRSSKTA
jgi:hypothetical protein